MMLSTLSTYQATRISIFCRSFLFAVVLPHAQFDHGGLVVLSLSKGYIRTSYRRNSKRLRGKNIYIKQLYYTGHTLESVPVVIIFKSLVPRSRCILRYAEVRVLLAGYIILGNIDHQAKTMVYLMESILRFNKPQLEGPCYDELLNEAFFSNVEFMFDNISGFICIGNTHFIQLVHLL
jgi:hypothetical protein